MRRTSEAFTQFGATHRSMERFSIDMLKKIKPVSVLCCAGDQVTGLLSDDFLSLFHLHGSNFRVIFDRTCYDKSFQLRLHLHNVKRVINPGRMQCVR